ncbi:MAG TPA: cytochrome-c peroxidase [Deinococcales bacterium]|nr:cytochrome-c peroxidase [Deinococcales bacterium]
MKRTIVMLVCAAAVLLTATAVAQEGEASDSSDSLLVTARSLFEPIPQEAPDLAGNEYSDAKELLGRSLFFDPRLSSSWFISCNSCHNVGTAGVDLQPRSIGHAWQRGGRNSPTVLNAVFNIAQFWDGRAEDLAAQAMGPIQDALEMNNTPERVISTLASMPGYVDMFADAFPEEEDPVTFENIALAIEVFESTLITPDSPFDQYLEGDTDALTAEEKEGLNLFVRRGCAACHQGINVGGQGYFPFGVVEQPDAEVLPHGDVGRFGVTDVESDRYSFKSPTLRNIALTPPYFHSGVVWDLEEAVRIMGSAQLGTELTENEVQSITLFLHTLTGEQPLVTIPEMPAVTPATPRPEPMSR